MNSGAESELDAKFAALLLGSRDAIVEQTLQGDILSWNPGAERLYGHRACDVLGRNISVVVPADRRRFEASFARAALVGKQVHAVETTRVHRSGQPMRVTVSKSPGPSHDTFIDVSSLSVEEVVRRRSQASFQALLEAAPDAMVCVNSDGAITLVNGQMRELFQYSAEELLGQPVEVLMPAHLAGAHARMRDGFLREGRRRPMGTGVQLVARRRDGSTFPADISLASLDTDHGVVVTAAIRDVSERRAVDAALRESERRFRQLAGSVPAAFTLRSLDPPKLLYASPWFARVFGYDIRTEEHPELGPLGLLGHIVEEDRDRIHDIGAHLLERGGRVDADYRVLWPSGEIRWVHTTAAPVLEDDGTFTRIAGVSEDITDRKLAEDELRRARNEAEHANAAKDQFLSRMSHQLRTPLNSVLGFAQLLELDPLTRPQQDSVKHILRAGRHLLSLIEDLLDIARIDNGGALDTAAEPVQLARAITDAIGLMRPAADKAVIELRYPTRQQDTDRYLQVDPRRLSQVLLNLLSNAIKYNQPGGHVDVRCSIQAHDILHIAISDSGIGIPAEHFGRLFEPFDRLDAHARNIEGTGIGLAITQRLLHTMAAQLQVASTVGVGSTFTIAIGLPEPTDPADAPPAAEQIATPAQPDKDSPGTLTLLYLEDNPGNAELMRRILALRPNWRMTHADTGAAGLDLVRRSPPNLVFLDLGLPDTNAADLIKQIRTGGDTADPPVITVSADASTAQINHLHGLGASIHLTEPFEVTDILQLLDLFDPASGLPT